MALTHLLGLIAGLAVFGGVVYFVLRPLRRERGRAIHYVDMTPVPQQSAPLKG